MDLTLRIVCTPKLYLYDILKLEDCELRRSNVPSEWKLCKVKTLKLDCVFVHYFVKELTLSWFYRHQVIHTMSGWNGPDVLLLTSTKRNLIDYNWNDRIYELARERCEVDHALSWLSTLGGAFSALGDYFEKCADTAGKISVHQLKLALRLGDPNVQARCRLYLSLSLIQKKRFKVAAQIIRQEYGLVKKQTVLDERLVRMCRGIWSKLQYERSLYKIKR